MVFVDGLTEKSKLTKIYYLVIAKVNQDMLDNDANFQEANEYKVDEKITEIEDRPEREVTKSELSNDKDEKESLEGQQQDNITIEDSITDNEESAFKKVKKKTTMV